MLTKREKIIIGIGLAILLAIGWTQAYFSHQTYQDNQTLKNQNRALSVELGSKSIDQANRIKDQEKTITGLNQELEALSITNQVNGMYIQTLEYKYLRLHSYAFMAQEILLANGIEFRMVEGHLDYDELLKEESEDK